MERESFTDDDNALAVVDPARPDSVAAAQRVGAGKPPRAGEVLAYVCRGRARAAPATATVELKALLR